MKKILLLLMILPLTLLVSCHVGPQTVTYTDDDPVILPMSGDTLKILQLTDLHLTYGIDANDRKTFKMIDELVAADHYDLIVISGDMTMSPSAPSLFRMLIKHMEALQTPWTFVFGNHETDYNSYADFLNEIQDTQYLCFKVGPELSDDGIPDGGVGNYRIEFTKDGVPFYNLYFMDSHAERTVYTEEEGEYDYVKTSQVDWYVSHVSQDTVDSVMYMHIPLRQFMDAKSYPYVGYFGEDKVYPQGVDTGLFDAIVQYGKTVGVFVGHDHLNDFYFTLDGVMLAYGQISGYNAYGDLERGGRVVQIASDGTMSTYLVLQSEVNS